MKTLYIERSTGECRNGDWVEALDLDGIKRIVVGTGPGSFAGIRSAIAFAQGYRLGRPDVEIMGLPSACALVGALGKSALPPSGKLAVLGDARQGKIWIALFDGYRLEREIFQVNVEELSAIVPNDYAVVSPDDRRIGDKLKELFAERYLGERLPTSEGLERFAEACPSILQPEPLPIYLNPAVRT